MRHRQLIFSRSLACTGQSPNPGRPSFRHFGLIANDDYPRHTVLLHSQPSEQNPYRIPETPAEPIELRRRKPKGAFLEFFLEGTGRLLLYALSLAVLVIAFDRLPIRDEVSGWLHPMVLAAAFTAILIREHLLTRRQLRERTQRRIDAMRDF